MKETIKVVFAKKGRMRFLSHLDLMRLFARALRRAGMPVAVSQGFSPRPRIIIEPALKLGKESDSLQLRVRLDEWLKPSLFAARLQAELPDGIELKEAKAV